MKKQRSLRGGNPLPLRYFNVNAYHPDATAGVDVLHSSAYIRPKIGGRVTRRHCKSKTRGKRGGFIPTVMEPFVAGVSKYIVPIALYSGYKLMMNHTSKKKKSKKRN